MKTKPDYWYEQSAVIPFRINNNKLEILLITTIKKKKWIIPKGIIEENLTEVESAEKEALEEAGVIGNVKPELIGKYKYKKWGGKCRVMVYALKADKILDRWDESFRDRKWIEINKVGEYILDKNLIKIIDKLKKDKQWIHLKN